MDNFSKNLVMIRARIAYKSLYKLVSCLKRDIL